MSFFNTRSFINTPNRTYNYLNNLHSATYGQEPNDTNTTLNNDNNSNDNERPSPNEDMEDTEGMNFIDYGDVMNEYLNNVQTMRRSLINTITTHQLFISQLQPQLRNLNHQTNLLYGLLLSHDGLSRSVRNSHSQRPRQQRRQQSPQTVNARREQNINLFADTIYRTIYNQLQQQMDGSNLPTQIPTVDIITVPMEDVPVVATDQQINDATTTIAFGSLTENQQFYERCPISYLVFDNNSQITRITHCGHYFDTTALMGWFRNSVVCPVCRHDVRETNQSMDTVV